jgi:hypothetical protein
MRSKLWKLCLVTVLALVTYLSTPPAVNAAVCYCVTRQDCWNCYPAAAGEPVLCRYNGCLWL